MGNNRGPGCAVTALLALTFFGALCAMMIGADIMMCHAKWDRPSEWGFFSGCRVLDDRGEWIPAERFRSVE